MQKVSGNGSIGSDRPLSLRVAVHLPSARTALRKGRILLRKEGAIGLQLPDGTDIDEYRVATEIVLKAAGLDGFTVVSVEKSPKGRFFWDDPISKTKNKSKCVILLPDGAVPPASIRVSLDAVVSVPRIHPMQLVYAARTALDVRLTPDQAKQLLSFPNALVLDALRRDRPLSITLAKLEEVARVDLKKSATELGVEDLPGFGAAKEWAISLGVDLVDWRNGVIGWSDVDCGLLLSGPPGTGKTMFARAVARTCNAHFIATSSAQWQAAGHLGDYLAAMRKDFREAAERAPCILFIDEIDAIGSRRNFSGDHANYGVQVVNGLLEALDGSDAREGVVVIAASNFPDELDPALRRPGRLDRLIVLGLPDYDDRKTILTIHLGRVLDVSEINYVARVTDGYSGAELAQLARDARRNARRRRSAVNLDDLKAILPRPIPIEGEVRWTACVHEAGHAIVGMSLGFGKPDLVTVQRFRSHRSENTAFVSWSRNIALQRSRESYRNDIAMLLGGRAAEEVVLGTIHDGSGGVIGSDLQRATDLATFMLAALGMGEELSYSHASDSKELEKLRTSDPILRRRVEHLLATELERAMEIVRHHRSNVEKLALAVSERELVTFDMMESIVGQFGLD